MPLNSCRTSTFPDVAEHRLCADDNLGQIHTTQNAVTHERGLADAGCVGIAKRWPDSCFFNFFFNLTELILG